MVKLISFLCRIGKNEQLVDSMLIQYGCCCRSDHRWIPWCHGPKLLNPLWKKTRGLKRELAQWLLKFQRRSPLWIAVHDCMSTPRTRAPLSNRFVMLDEQECPPPQCSLGCEQVASSNIHTDSTGSILAVRRSVALLICTSLISFIYTTHIHTHFIYTPHIHTLCILHTVYI